jgi:zinc protease
MIRYTLENGMRGVVDPTGRSDAAAVYVWINVGSADEPPGMEGAAHFVEHMVFKGTHTYGVGEVAAAIEAMGGDLNAWTSFDETVFHATVPAAAAVPAMGVLAEMLRSARFDTAELRRERTVILEEIRGTEDDPDIVLSEATYASAWPDHPYGRPIIGTTRSVRGMTRDALHGFYVRHYQPANACLAVAGPVDVDAVTRAAAGFFGGGGAAPPRTQRTPGGGARPARALRRGFEACLVDLAWPGPGHGDPAVAPLDVLCVALGGGASSPLEARLRLREGLCHSAEAAYDSERDAGMAVVSLHARDGMAARAVAAAREEVAAAREGSLGDAEVERAKAQILADRVFGRETVDGRAHTLAFHTERLGSPDAWQGYDEEIRRVTSSAVLAAARRWLDPEREVATALVPKGERLAFRRSPAEVRSAESERVGAGGAALGAARTLGGSAGGGVGESDSAEGGVAGGVAGGVGGGAPAPARDGAVAATSPTWTSAPYVGVRAPTRTVLANGLRVLLDPDDSEVAAIRIVGLGGALSERAESAGRSTGWARAVVRGAGGRDAVGFARAVEALAGSVGAASGRSSQGIRGEFVAARFEEGLELVADTLLRPTFAEEEVVRVREELVEALSEREDHPEQVLMERIWALAYGRHPYALPGIGTRSTLARLDAGRLRAHHRRWCAGENLVVAVSGGFDPDRVRATLERLLAPLPAGARLALPPTPVRPSATRRTTIRSGREQAHVALAFPGVAVDDPRQPEVEILAAVLGGQGGRLFVELREAHGLAYHVGAASQEGVQPGLFMCTVATDPSRAAEAERRLEESLASAAAGPVSVDEVERARRYLVGAIELDLQTAGARANLAAYTDLYGHDGLKYRALVRRRLEGVEVDDVRRCAARVLACPIVRGRLVPAGKA